MGEVWVGGTEWTAENDSSIEINKIIQLNVRNLHTERKRQGNNIKKKVLIWFWSVLWCAIKFSFHVLPRIIATFNFNQLPMYMSIMLFKVALFSIRCAVWNECQHSYAWDMNNILNTVLWTCACMHLMFYIKLRVAQISYCGCKGRSAHFRACKQLEKLVSVRFVM